MVVPAPAPPAFFCHLFFSFLWRQKGEEPLSISLPWTCRWWNTFSDGICSSDSPIGAVVRICGFYNLKDCPSSREFLWVASSSGSELGEGLVFPGSLLRSALCTGSVRTGFAPVSASSSCQACGYCVIWTTGWRLRCLSRNLARLGPSHKPMSRLGNCNCLWGFSVNQTSVFRNWDQAAPFPGFADSLEDRRVFLFFEEFMSSIV